MSCGLFRSFTVSCAVGMGFAVTCAPDVAPWLETPTQRALLFQGLRSYTAPAAVKRQLGVRTWTTRKERRGRSRGCLSASFSFKVLEVSVSFVAHFGSGGKLTLTFLNDKLVRTTFHPVDGPAYLRKLLSQGGLTLAGGSLTGRAKLGRAPAHTRVRAVTDGQGTRVSWADRRLLKAYWEVQSRGSSRYME